MCLLFARTSVCENKCDRLAKILNSQKKTTHNNLRSQKWIVFYYTVHRAKGFAVAYARTIDTPRFIRLMTDSHSFVLQNVSISPIQTHPIR